MSNKPTTRLNGLKRGLRRLSFSETKKVSSNETKRAFPNIQRPESQLQRSLDVLIADLPTELLLYLLDILPLAEAWSLALTCKGLHHLLVKCGGLHPLALAAERYRFLVNYERDLSKWVTCTRHVKLHRWEKQGTSPYNICHNRRTEFSDNYSLLLGFEMHRSSGQPPLYLTEDQRRLYLRHELFGAKYGARGWRQQKRKDIAPTFSVVSTISLKVLPSASDAVNISFPTPELRLLVHKRTTYKVRFYERHGERYVTPALRSFACTACMHSTNNVRAIFQGIFSHLVRNEQPATAAARSVSNLNCKYPSGWHECPLLFKCAICATDTKLKFRTYDVQTDTIMLGSTNQFQGDYHEVEIVFDTWQDTGGLYESHLSIPQLKVMRERCSIPPHEEWRLQTETEFRHRVFEDLQEDYEGLQAGMSRRNTYSAPDRECETQFWNGIQSKIGYVEFLSPDPAKRHEHVLHNSFHVPCDYDRLPFRLVKR